MEPRYEYKFVTPFFLHENLGDKLTEIVAEAQEHGWDYHDVRMAQSSASGTGMSAILVLRKAHY